MPRKVAFDEKTGRRVLQATLDVERSLKKSIPLPNERRRSSSTNGTGSAVSSYPCKITGSPTVGEYPCDIHKNGKHEDKTGTGTIQALDLHINETIPSGTWVVGHDSTVEQTGAG